MANNDETDDELRRRVEAIAEKIILDRNACGFAELGRCGGDVKVSRHGPKLPGAKGVYLPGEDFVECGMCGSDEHFLNLRAFHRGEL
ncbi:hypothetical protein [Candidatus Binatus sp.]|uniref:hypothetical protein n=1 Tax=Candidatus Binatus sp. TaxID=2811406 RepID=UPI002F95BA62